MWLPSFTARMKVSTGRRDVAAIAWCSRGRARRKSLGHGHGHLSRQRGRPGRPMATIGAYASGVSKAFVNEDSAAAEGPLVPSRPAKPQPITPAGYHRMQEQRAHESDETARARL